MPKHTSNSSSSSSSASSNSSSSSSIQPRLGYASAKPHEQDLMTYLILCSLPECISRTSILLSGNTDLEEWYSKRATRRAFQNWMATNPHKVVGPRRGEIVEGQWYCDSSEERYVKLTLGGRKIAITFFSREINPDLVAPDSKEYVLGIM